MPDIHRVVARLLHRAQHQERDRALRRIALDLLDQLLEVLRLDAAAFRRAQRESECRDELLELQHLEWIGRLVDAIERGHVPVFEVRGHGLVRQQHELFDQPVRDVALGRDDVRDEALFVEDHLRFGQVEVDRAAPVAPRVKDLEQLAHQLEHRHQRAILRDRFRILVRQDRVDRGIGHARVAANHAVVHLIAQHVAARRHFHQAGLHQPIDVRLETA
jgi:hypothetical protein